MIRDITGGLWGLMIILSAFMIQLIAFGIALSIGVYNIEFLTFTDNAFAVSLVSALNTGVFLGSGPLASFLMNHMQHRTVVLIGSALVSSSMVCMPFLPGIEYMYVIFGIVEGLGSCLVYVPSHVMSGLYYDKHQSLATGVATAGSGLGMTIFPIFVGYIIEVYTWRPSFLIIAGIAFNLFVFALLLRPLPKSIDKKSSAEELKMLEPTSLNAITDAGTASEPKVFKHFFVFCNVNFDIYFFSNILWNMGLNMIVMFGPDFLTTKGLSKIEAAFMLTILGFCTFFGSVFTGSVGNLRFVNRLYLYQLVCIISGVAVVCFPIVETYSAIVIINVFIGFGFGGILGLLVVLTADLLGPESLGDGVGYLMLANGIGCFAGPPVAGVLRDIYGNYNVAFFTAAVLLFVGGIVMSVIPIKERLYGKSKKQTTLELEICADHSD